jgi:putative hydrolase of the HAD superfamily
LADIRVIFFDVGGVLLTNAWDRVARQEAIQEFALDDIEFADRHEQVIAAFETGHLTESQYLERTVFHRDRSFTPEDFRSFMYGRTRMLDDNAFDIVDALNGRDNVLLATLNNESRELNDWRLRHYGLLDRFHVFVSSCYVGARKPDAAIYRLALDLTQCPAEACAFIDDRPLNTQCARKLGIHTVDYRGSDDLREQLADLGVRF